MELPFSQIVQDFDPRVTARLDKMVFGQKWVPVGFVSIGLGLFLWVFTTAASESGATKTLFHDLPVIAVVAALVGLAEYLFMSMLHYRSTGMRLQLTMARLWMLAILVALGVIAIPHVSGLGVVALIYLIISALMLILLRLVVTLMVALVLTFRWAVNLMADRLPLRLVVFVHRSKSPTEAVPSPTESSRRPPRNPPTA